MVVERVVDGDERNAHIGTCTLEVRPGPRHLVSDCAVQQDPLRVDPLGILRGDPILEPTYGGSHLAAKNRKLLAGATDRTCCRTASDSRLPAPSRWARACGRPPRRSHGARDPGLTAHFARTLRLRVEPWRRWQPAGRPSVSHRIARLTAASSRCAQPGLELLSGPTIQLASTSAKPTSWPPIEKVTRRVTPCLET